MSRFFSLDARIGRARLVAGLVVALALGWIGVLLLRPGEPAVVVAVGVAGGAVVAKLLVEAARRRRDANASVGAVVALFAGTAAAIVAAMAYALGTGAFVAPEAVVVVAAIAWAVLLLGPGSPATNDYGPPVRRPLLPTFGDRPGVAGLLLALAFAGIGGALGYAGVRWLAAMRSHHRAVERQVDAVPARVDAAAPDAIENAYREQGRR